MKKMLKSIAYIDLNKLCLTKLIIFVKGVKKECHTYSPKNLIEHCSPHR